MTKFHFLISCLILVFPFQAYNQCSTPFIEADCYGPKDMNILEAIQWEKDRELQGFSFNDGPSSSVIRKLEKPEYFRLVDSIFQECNNYMIDQFGEENYCQKIQFAYRNTLGKLPHKYSREPSKIYFVFHHDGINCWDRKYRNIEFSFDKDENGKYQIEYPQLPKCYPGDCKFPFNDFTEVIRKGVADYQIDTRYNINTMNDINDLKFSYSKMPFQSRQLSFSRKTGNLEKDTIFKNTSNPSWQFNARTKNELSFDEIIQQADAIVDATWQEKISLMVNGIRKQYYIFEVHSVLKGTNVSSVIAVDISSIKLNNFGNEANSGLRVLLMLSQLQLEPHKSVLLPKETQIWQSSQQVITGKYPNVYSEIFPYISSQSNQEIQILDPLNYTSDITISWLDKNKKSKLKKSNGLVTGIGYMEWTEDNNSIHVDITLASEKDYTYLVYKEFEIIYDTTMVGAYAVKNGNLSASPYFTRRRGNLRTLPQTVLAEGYDIEMVDTSADRILVKITLRKYDKIAQVSPIQLNQDYNSFSFRYSKSNLMYTNSRFLNLNFNVKPNEKRKDFKVEIKVDSFEIKDEYYDFKTNTEQRYAYQHVYENVKTLKLARQNPLIHKVVPPNYTVGDTITLHGENLDTFLDKVELPFETEVDGLLCYRKFRLNKKWIKEASYDKLTLEIPPHVNIHRYDYKFYPTNGHIIINHTVGPEFHIK